MNLKDFFIFDYSKFTLMKISTTNMVFLMHPVVTDRPGF